MIDRSRDETAGAPDGGNSPASGPAQQPALGPGASGTPDVTRARQTVPAPRKRAKSEPPKVTFGPVENGLDYLLSVTEHLAGRPQPRDLKYAILHLAAATEVLFKARLQLEHWSLVFENPRDATRSSFDAADFKSCGSIEALERLQNIAGLDTAKTGSTKKDLELLIKWRNALQHYGLVTVQDGKETQTVYAPAVEKLAANLLEFLLAFVRDDLRPKLIDPFSSRRHIDEEIAKVSAGLSRIEMYLKFRWKRLLPELELLKDVTVKCPLCKQFALVVDGLRPECRFCDTANAGDGTAVEYVREIQGIDTYSHYRDGGGELVAICPVCEYETLVADVEFASGRTVAFLCFSCASEFESLQFCTACGRPIEEGDEDGWGTCPECFNLARRGLSGR